jgi:serine/threonine protein kinase/tetratricopeptide (TPR) repeat protein
MTCLPEHLLDADPRGYSDTNTMAPDAALPLTERLTEEMAACWRRGEPVAVETFLTRHPELGSQVESVIALIDEEICLRQEYGKEVSATDYHRRFPQWRTQLEVLFSCHRLLGSAPAIPRFPEAGERWGEFRLVQELGRGAQGRVFLATQPALADRPVVLKLTPCRGEEHLSLARLQHTYIVPLFSAFDDTERDLRALCMPYFGGLSLAALLMGLPANRRPTGRDILATLDTKRRESWLPHSNAGPARRFLGRASFEQAIGWIGACLADALRYAHERGLMHLDLKPSNVLLAADGQPMLLDFHLAHEPITPGGQPPRYLGGSPHYMSPEQHKAVEELRAIKPITCAVDGRSDIYSLGLILAEALAGSVPLPARDVYANRLAAAGVSTGLRSIICKCLSPEPSERYRDAGALAADLSRQVNDLPLKGVPNHDLRERWRKWRRRQPHRLKLLIMSGMVISTCAACVLLGISYCRNQAQQARESLVQVRRQFDDRRYIEAVGTLEIGLGLLQRVPGHEPLRQELMHRLQLAHRAAAAQGLHHVADQFRVLYGTQHDITVRDQVLDGLRDIWAARQTMERIDCDLGPDDEERIRVDLLDVAILLADLQVRRAPAINSLSANRQALGILAEAETLFGPSAVLYFERSRYADALGDKHLAQTAADKAGQMTLRTAWEHYALGRALLNAGKLEVAALHLDQAVKMQPRGLWPYFYQGLCAYQLKDYAKSLSAFSACLPQVEIAGCYYYRALAYAGLGRTDLALADYDSALGLDPSLAAAARNRGLLHYRAGEYTDAEADLRRALNGGAPPSLVHCDLARVDIARKDRVGALMNLRRSLASDPNNAEARALFQQLQQP